DWVINKKMEGSKLLLRNQISEILPARFVARFCELYVPEASKTLQELSDLVCSKVARQFQEWTLVPSGTVGYSKAEVTRGGVDTDELSSKTMECKKVPGLYFIGEVVDVTGHLGGFNFQWAWASGAAAGRTL